MVNKPKIYLETSFLSYMVAVFWDDLFAVD